MIVSGSPPSISEVAFQTVVTDWSSPWLRSWRVAIGSPISTVPSTNPIPSPKGVPGAPAADGITRRCCGISASVPAAPCSDFGSVSSSVQAAEPMRSTTATRPATR